MTSCMTSAASSACSNAATCSGGMPASAPPKIASTGDSIWLATSVGAGASFRHGPTTVPYSPMTPASPSPSVPARYDIRPPMQKPIV